MLAYLFLSIVANHKAIHSQPFFHMCISVSQLVRNIGRAVFVGIATLLAIAVFASIAVFAGLRRLNVMLYSPGT